MLPNDTPAFLKGPTNGPQKFDGEKFGFDGLSDDDLLLHLKTLQATINGHTGEIDSIDERAEHLAKQRENATEQAARLTERSIETADEYQRRTGLRPRVIQDMGSRRGSTIVLEPASKTPLKDREIAACGYPSGDGEACETPATANPHLDEIARVATLLQEERRVRESFADGSPDYHIADAKAWKLRRQLNEAKEAYATHIPPVAG